MSEMDRPRPQDVASDSDVLTRRERDQIDHANRSGLQPVIFIHGLWLLASSWSRWAELFREAGYCPLTPGWPDDPETVDEARDDPERLAHKKIGQVAEHHASVIAALNRKPAIVGHSFGGLLAQILAGRGLSAATVAISPAAFQGVLPLPLSALKSASPVLLNPANYGRAVALTLDQFRYAFANAVEGDEAERLHRSFAAPAPGAPLFQDAFANLNPWTEAKVDSGADNRGPLLVMAGEKDHTVPPVVARAAYDIQRRNPGITDYLLMADRGHSLTIDDGWREVALAALDFVRRCT